MNSFICPMIYNCVKLEQAVTLVENIGTAVSLMFPIWNKMVLPALNILKLLELVENELKKTFVQKI